MLNHTLGYAARILTIPAHLARVQVRAGPPVHQQVGDLFVTLLAGTVQGGLQLVRSSDFLYKIAEDMPLEMLVHAATE